MMLFNYTVGGVPSQLETTASICTRASIAIADLNLGFDEAENRLHTIKAVMVATLGS